MTPAGGRSERVVFSLPRIIQETFVRQAELHRTIHSTSTRALELATNLDARLPLVVLAESQTAGRGRGSNVWWSAPGALTFSLILDLANQNSNSECWPQVALAAAVGVCEALEKTAPGNAFGIRWPNDVCCGMRKICGILPELHLNKSQRLVLGVGINANNSIADAPDELRDNATSLFDLTRKRTNLTALVIDVLLRLEKRLGDLASGSPELPQTWAERCIQREQLVRIKTDNVEIKGTCEGIDTDGALLLQTTSGTQRFYGGTIITNGRA